MYTGENPHKEVFMKIILISLFLFATTALASDLDRDMRRIVDNFYNVYITVRSSGIPSEKEQLKFKPYLSASLSRLLKDAAVAEQKYYRTTKGEAPPLVEGDLFTSLFEGASAFTVSTCDISTTSCSVEFRYNDPACRRYHHSRHVRAFFYL